jgi:hypothetical protein
MATKSSSKVNPELEKLLAELLKEAKAKGSPEKPAMSLTDKMKIIDRVIKVEAIKAKMAEESYGSGFQEE